MSPDPAGGEMLHKFWKNTLKNRQKKKNHSAEKNILFLFLGEILKTKISASGFHCMMQKKFFCSRCIFSGVYL